MEEGVIQKGTGFLCELKLTNSFSGKLGGGIEITFSKTCQGNFCIRIMHFGSAAGFFVGGFDTWQGRRRESLLSSWNIPHSPQTHLFPFPNCMLDFQSFHFRFPLCVAKL